MERYSGIDRSKLAQDIDPKKELTGVLKSWWDGIAPDVMTTFAGDWDEEYIWDTMLDALGDAVNGYPRWDPEPSKESLEWYSSLSFADQKKFIRETFPKGSVK